MDPRRFDALAKIIAAPRTRRRLVGGLAVVAGLLGLAPSRRIAAQQRGYLNAGDACYTDAQCSLDPNRAGFFELICSGNGFDYDGPFNCCALAGGPCSLDEGCCGGLVCNGETCGQRGQASLGDACFAASDCSREYPELGVLVCADNGFGANACCRLDGGSCGGPLSGRENDWVCCGQLTCREGRCGLG